MAQGCWLLLSQEQDFHSPIVAVKDRSGMMQQEPSLNYPTVCKYVGQLFLESRHELEQVVQQVRQREAELNDRLAAAEKERDDALRLVHELRSQPKE